MNLVLIVTDTFRADYLGCYGNPWIKTPKLDAFARQSVSFTSVHGEGLPTMEARRVFMTGRGILPFEDEPPLIGLDPTLAGWRPLSETDVTLADFLSQRGYFCGMSTDLWHFFKPNLNLHRNFHIWDFIRGQEADQWRTAPLSRHDPRKHIPAHLYNEKTYERRMRQYLQNTDWWQGEEDYFAARTMRSAVQFLENSRDRAPFFLYVDTFDPHEPFDPPRQYAEMYCDKLPCERPLWGYGVDAAKTRDDDIPWIKGCYAGEVSFVDNWVGFLIDAIDRMGLAQDTVVAFTTDHGTEFKEHGRMMKSPAQLYSNITRLPLIVRAPGQEALAGKKVDALISATDLAPTLLRLIGETPPETMNGLNFWPTATGEKAEIRDHLVMGFGRAGAVRNHDWLLHTLAQPNAKYGGGEKQAQPALFDLKADPEETRNVIDKRPEARQRMLALARKLWPEAV
ncbi:MAG: sulfatase [Candidatus Sumerlaeota bacterium]|nr:sulfatase [Candidatus Sumerlaeota bacterium]